MFYVCVCVCWSPLSFSLLFFINFLSKHHKDKGFPALFEMYCTYYTDGRESDREHCFIWGSKLIKSPRLQSQWCTLWYIQWKSTHAMDVCYNVMSMQLSRNDSAEEAGVDCIPTHKSQHILSGCLLGGKCPLTIPLIQWKYGLPCYSMALLLYVHAVPLLRCCYF